MAVDILPASIPLNASIHFSNAFLPYLDSIINQYRTSINDEYSHSIKNATIAVNGKLERPHEWLQPAVDKFYKDNSDTDTLVGVFAPSTEKSSTPANASILKKKRVLILGSGMVARPAVDEIAKRADIDLLIASNSPPELSSLTSKRQHSNVRSRVIDITQKDTISSLIQEADVVISLLPATMHVDIAHLCIQHSTHLITASYISPEMRALHDSALSSSTLLLNELGLDPGIDHISAISLISSLKAKNHTIHSFTSFCGGLPSPSVAHTVPLGYKFSWSPRGVLLAAKNGAKYRLNGEVIDIPPNQLLCPSSRFQDIPISHTFKTEGLPNRDSLAYAQTYGLQNARTILRGTLRYPGFSSLMHSFASLGLLESSHLIHPKSWSSLIPLALQNHLGTTNTSLPGAIESVISHESQPELLSALHWLGVSPHSHYHSTPLPSHWIPAPPLPPLPKSPQSPLSLLTHLLSSKLSYSPSEHDVVILSHQLISSLPASSPSQTQSYIHTSTLITHGAPTHSAMSLTVGLPIAFAALSVLDGHVSARGVHGPTTDADTRRAVLDGLVRVGLGMEEHVRVVDSSTMRATYASGEQPTVEQTLIRRSERLSSGNFVSEETSALATGRVTAPVSVDREPRRIFPPSLN